MIFGGGGGGGGGGVGWWWWWRWGGGGVGAGGAGDEWVGGGSGGGAYPNAQWLALLSLSPAIQRAEPNSPRGQTEKGKERASVLMPSA
jgi:hypothetical protein